MIKTKIEPIARDIKVIVDQTLSPNAQQEAIASFAEGKFQDADSKNRTVLGRTAPHTTTVDGSQSAALDTVNPNRGSIIFEWELVSDVLQWILQTLKDRSPVVSGDYRQGHVVMADGAQVSLDGDLPAASEFVFVNTVPYARKIEIGKTKSGRPFVVQVPNRIYERTAADAKGRFGNIAKIVFDYRSVVGGAVGKWSGSASAARLAARNHRRSRIHDWLTRQPAIIVTQLGGLSNSSGLS